MIKVLLSLVHSETQNCTEGSDSLNEDTVILCVGLPSCVAVKNGF